MARGRSEEFKTPLCRVSYAQTLFKARSQNGGAEKFGATLIFPKTADKAAFNAALKAAITQEWGDKGLEKAQSGIIRTPFLDGAGKEARNKTTGDLHPGMGPDVWFIRVSANADRPPLLRYRSPTIPATEEEIYSGCYGFAVLTAFAWNNPQNGDGVSFGISFFQKTQDGERLGGGGPTDPSKYFEKIEDHGAAPAATSGGAGAGGLFGD
jgi:hypothetical protein